MSTQNVHRLAYITLALVVIEKSATTNFKGLGTTFVSMLRRRVKNNYKMVEFMSVESHFLLF